MMQMQAAFPIGSATKKIMRERERETERERERERERFGFSENVDRI